MWHRHFNTEPASTHGMAWRSVYVVVLTHTHNLIHTYNHTPQARDVEYALWSYTQNPRTPPEVVVEALSARAIQVMDDFLPKGLTNLLWTFAALTVDVSEVLLAAISARCVATMPRFTAHFIVTVLTSYTSLPHRPDEELLQVLMHQALERADDFTCTQLECVVCILKQFGVAVDPRLTAAMLRAKWHVYRAGVRDSLHVSWS